MIAGLVSWPCCPHCGAEHPNVKNVTRLCDYGDVWVCLNPACGRMFNTKVES